MCIRDSRWAEASGQLGSFLELRVVQHIPEEHSCSNEGMAEDLLSQARALSASRGPKARVELEARP
eukprot:1453372-Alexandrium_andersonii.AAC.1